LGSVTGKAAPRELLFGWYGKPGTPNFKVMVRDQDYKYIYMSNGGREQLFHLTEDPNELNQLADLYPEITARLRLAAVDEISRHEPLAGALTFGGLRSFPFKERPLARIRQFNLAIGVKDFTVN
ncbi:hypothetical protein K0U00_44950, partial [Paenibacillus sepulcri]|nr:hypothetical protein [Paenibacillus sepulcri]